MNPNNINIETLKRGWEDIQKRFPGAKPFASFVLGSGWGDAIKVFNIKGEMPYSEITGFGKAGVVGHASKLSLVDIDGREFFVFQGRRHYYEGEGWTPVIATAYYTMRSGAKLMFLSNAAGGINYAPGELMIITDHINSLGSNPLIGPHLEEFGPRFPDMSSTYNHDLIKVLEGTAQKVGVELVKGIYVAATGPSYETPAEIRAFKTLGGDAVGMSTIPEAVAANSMGIRIAAISCITNYCAGISKVALNHKEVVEIMDQTMPKIHKLLPEIVRTFSKL